MSLNPRNCYECQKYNYCSFRRNISDAIDRHVSWVNVDMAGTPDWQRLFEATAKACLAFKPDKTDPTAG